MEQNSCTIKLYKDVPLHPGYTDVYGGSYATWLEAATQITLLNQAFQNPWSGINRPSATITVNYDFETLEGYNYLSFQNSATGRVFFAFVTAAQALGAGVTRLTYIIDDWGTWHEAATFGRCYVEREHVAADTVDNWGVCESLNYTELLPQQSQTIAKGGTIYYYALISPPNPRQSPTGAKTDYEIYIEWMSDYKDKLTRITALYNGVTTSLDCWMSSNAETFSVAIGNLPVLNEAGGLAARGLSQYVVRCFASRINYGKENSDNTFNLVPGEFAFDGYVPHNKKCLDSPFRKYVISSQQGGSVEITAREVLKWGALSITHGIINSLGAGRYLKVNIPGNDTDSLILYSNCEVDLPTQSVAGASQVEANKRNTVAAIIPAAITAVGGAALTAASGGAAAPAVAAFGLSVAGTAASSAFRHDEILSQGTTARVPSVGQDNVDLILGRTGFSFIAYGMPAAAARRIDEYFDCYGYAVQAYKVPNMAGMSLYNFVKTQGAAVSGAIPGGALETLQRILDNGVKIWHVAPGTAGANRRTAENG